MEAYTRLQCFAQNASLHRLLRMRGTVYLPDIYCLSARYLRITFTLSIAQNASLHRLFRMGESDYLG